jgi:hypothetical protein
VQYPWGGVGYLHADSLQLQSNRDESVAESVAESVEEEETDQEAEERKRGEETSLKSLCAEYGLSTDGTSDEICERLRAGLGWNQNDFERALENLSQKMEGKQKKGASGGKEGEEGDDEGEQGGEEGSDVFGVEEGRNIPDFGRLVFMDEDEATQRHVRNRTVSDEIMSPGDRQLQRHARNRTTSDGVPLHGSLVVDNAPAPPLTPSRGLSLSPKTMRKSGRSQSGSGVQRLQWRRYSKSERERSSSSSQQQLSASLHTHDQRPENDLKALRRRQSAPLAMEVGKLPMSLNLMLTRGSQMSKMSSVGHKRTRSGSVDRGSVYSSPSSGRDHGRTRSISAADGAESDAAAVAVRGIDLNINLLDSLQGTGRMEGENSSAGTPVLASKAGSGAAASADSTAGEGMPVKDRVEETRRQVREKISRAQAEREVKRRAGANNGAGVTNEVPHKSANGSSSGEEESVCTLAAVDSSPSSGWQRFNPLRGIGSAFETKETRPLVLPALLEGRASQLSLHEAEERSKAVDEVVKEKEGSGKITAEERAIIMQADRRLRAEMEAQRAELEAHEQRQEQERAQETARQTEVSRFGQILSNTLSLSAWTGSMVSSTGVSTEASTTRASASSPPSTKTSTAASAQQPLGAPLAPTAEGLAAEEQSEEEQAQSMPVCTACQFSCPTKFCGECGAKMPEAPEAGQKEEEGLEHQNRVPMGKDEKEQQLVVGEGKDGNAAGAKKRTDEQEQSPTKGEKWYPGKHLRAAVKKGVETTHEEGWYPGKRLMQKMKDTKENEKMEDTKENEKMEGTKENEKMEGAKEEKQQEAPNSGLDGEIDKHEERRWQLSSLDAPDPASEALESLYHEYDVSRMPMNAHEIEAVRLRSNSVPLSVLEASPTCRMRATTRQDEHFAEQSATGEYWHEDGTPSRSRRGSKTSSMRSVQKLFRKRRGSDRGTESVVGLASGADASPSGSAVTGQGGEREGKGNSDGSSGKGHSARNAPGSDSQSDRTSPLRKFTFMRPSGKKEVERL